MFRQRGIRRARPDWASDDTRSVVRAPVQRPERVRTHEGAPQPKPSKDAVRFAAPPT